MVKKHYFRQRAGFTLVELLVVIGIIAIFLTLLMAGIMRVREVALRVESTNNLKQIILAVHQFADENNGNLPNLPTVGDIVPDPPNGHPNITAPALFVRILPYIDQGNIIGFPPIKLFISPADPTIAGIMDQGISSYASNGRVFGNQPRFPGTFPDGTSNTIVFAEHYAHCGDDIFYYWQNEILKRAAFADYGDLIPVTKGNPPVSLDPDFPNLTFQAAPNPKNCNSGMAQTPHSSGMLIALGDGSVRQISPSISPPTYWGAVTPAGGEMLGSDWN